MRGSKRIVLVFACLIMLVIILSRCMEFGQKAPVKKDAIAGAESCRKCHTSIYDAYQHNPHHNTSQAVTTADLTHGQMPASNVYEFNDRLKLVVEKRDGGMYQVAYFDGKETIARRFDLAVGSGKRAYTYGYWEGSKLNQLPLSYFRQLKQWANSPGFPSNLVYFERPIGSRCLECHASFVDKTMEQTGALKVSENLDAKSMVYGIDCERCHGPAAQHVAFHLDSPEVKKAKYIVLYQNLTRKQKNDACAICHSGNDVEVERSTFAFKPGDKLEDYYRNSRATFATPELDVHGNQMQLLAKSKCFIQSKDMTCNSCHNTHEELKGNLSIYSQRCMSCHQTQKHSVETLKKGFTKSNCIDCHMPKETSKLISFQTARSTKLSPYQLRTHRIAIYPHPAK